MPPDGFKTVTLPEYLVDALVDYDDQAIPETIESLLEDGGESQDDALTPDEFEDRMRRFAEDIASTTSKRTADELESRLR